MVSAPGIVGNASFVEAWKEKEDAEDQEAVCLRRVTFHVLRVDEMGDGEEQGTEGEQEDGERDGFPRHFLRELEPVTQVLVRLVAPGKWPIVLVHRKRLVSNMRTFAHLSHFSLSLSRSISLSQSLCLSYFLSFYTLTASRLFPSSCN